MALWMRVSPWDSFPISFSHTCKIFHPELQYMLIAVVYCCTSWRMYGNTMGKEADAINIRKQR